MPCPNSPTALGQELARLRRARGLTIRALARRAAVDATAISRLESGRAARPTPWSLTRLAAALGVDIADLYVAAGYQPPYELPAFRPYLRAKYDLPLDAVDQLNAHFELVNARFGKVSGGRDAEPDR